MVLMYEKKISVGVEANVYVFLNLAQDGGYII
jgi:hypothetical protein